MRLSALAPALLLTSIPFDASPAWTYPHSPRGGVIETYHGTPVADPYRWLEDLDSAGTSGWVGEQNRFTNAFLRTLPDRKAIQDRLSRLWNFERRGIPVKKGGRYFLTRNSGLQNQSVLVVQESLESESRLLIDPNTLSADGTVALARHSVSHDGRWVAYGTATAGSDWNEIRVRGVDSGRDEPDHLRWIKFSTASWTGDGRGFFYSSYPVPGRREGAGRTFGALENQRVRYHRIGTDQSEDRLVFSVPGEPKWFVGGRATRDGRYLLVTVSRGTTSDNLVHLADLGDPSNPRIDAPLKPLVGDWEAEYDFIGNIGPRLFFLTNLGSPRRRIVAIDARSPERGGWTTVVPESADTIRAACLSGGKLVVHVMRDASSRLLVFAADGRPAGEIALPGLGTVDGISGDAGDPEMFFAFNSYSQPTCTYRHDMAETAPRLVFAPRVQFPLKDYETKQVFFPSRDGTRIPMFVTHRRGTALNGRNPLLLHGYGGFDISLTPTFSIPVLVWLEMGGVHAVPNLRGGGEYGKSWHEAGTRERKQNVFDDFIAAAEFLVARGYTSHERIVLSGRSNGGLLVGAVVNQRPDLCRVALPAVGVMDMLRFHKFTVGFAWVNDYGSSDDPEGFRYLSAYSPLHTVKAGARYPAILVTTGDHDDRVHPAHSFKYAATLQAAVDNGRGALPAMIRIETRAGHGAGKPTSKLIEEEADRLAFAAHFLGMRAPGSGQ